MRLIYKFGGTSMAGSERIAHSAALARAAAAEHELVTVVSAMDQVTEQLLDLAEAAGSGNVPRTRELLSVVRQSHETAARGISAGAQVSIEELLAKLETLAAGVLAVGELTPRLADAIVAFGERLSSVLMAEAMGCQGFDGQAAGIVTTDHFGEAEPLMRESMPRIAERIGRVLAPNKPVVVAGFIAATASGVVTTIGRGGSDYTATILGAALNADEIHIWSDVDGLMTADPRVVGAAKLLTHISFAEAVELGKFGAKSMHPRALEPAAQYGITVRMRNTFKPENAGTLICAKPPASPVSTGSISPGPVSAGSVIAVPALKDLAMLTVGGAGMVGRPGTAAAVFVALAQARINVHMISQSVSEAGISLVVSKKQAERARAALARALIAHDASGASRPAAVFGHIMADDVARDHAVSTVDVQPDLVILAVVGGAMRGTPGVAATLFTAIASAGVNVIAIAQGSSELSIALAVPAADANKAVVAVHAAFKLG